MENKIPLVAVCGPTASGKTGLAIAIAQQLDGEIVSADSMQIYRGMDIGTAKPTMQERMGIPHHLLDILDPGETFSVARFVEIAKETVSEIHARGKLPILTGGTGLYIDSLTRNILFPDIQDHPELRAQLQATAQKEGNDAVWALLASCDPILAQKLHPNNVGRVIRGIEVFRATGVPLSEWQRRSKLAAPPYRLCMLGLRWPQEILYERINQRVQIMMQQGLLAEARAFFQQAHSYTSAQAIGYKELFAYFQGEISIEQAVEQIQQESRRYAKRQMTWLRRDSRIHWIEPHHQTPEQLLARAVEHIQAVLPY